MHKVYLKQDLSRAYRMSTGFSASPLYRLYMVLPVMTIAAIQSHQYRQLGLFSRKQMETSKRLRLTFAELLYSPRRPEVHRDYQNVKPFATPAYSHKRGYTRGVNEFRQRQVEAKNKERPIETSQSILIGNPDGHRADCIVS